MDHTSHAPQLISCNYYAHVCLQSSSNQTFYRQSRWVQEYRWSYSKLMMKGGVMAKLLHDINRVHSIMHLMYPNLLSDNLYIRCVCVLYMCMGGCVFNLQQNVTYWATGISYLTSKYVWFASFLHFFSCEPETLSLVPPTSISMAWEQ